MTELQGAGVSKPKPVCRSEIGAKGRVALASRRQEYSQNGETT